MNTFIQQGCIKFIKSWQ